MSFLKIGLPFRIKNPILAVGADMKNSLCYAYHRSAFISGEISDLEELDNFRKFQRSITLFSKRFDLPPRVIACDKHPGYISTKFAMNFAKTEKARLTPVQHHHAHIASCMLENKLSNQKVIGVAFDGTGFGEDYTLWGGEFLIADYRNFQRAAHLRHIPLLGGKSAILQPWRLTSAWLYLVFGNKFLELDFAKRIDKDDWAILEKMWRQNFNAPLCSSMGRFFDAVAGLLLGICKVEFEAEAALKLERAASGYKSQPKNYPFKIKKINGVFVIDPALTFKGIVSDLRNGCRKEQIAANFHMTVARMIRNTCLKIRDDTRINAIVLSGGVFQNKILFKLSLVLLRKERFRVFTHNILSCSDLNISLGQAAVASYSN
ncbi:MAG: hypothetical protein ABH914_03640 [Candidatus Omnitrophota bacterium]